MSVVTCLAFLPSCFIYCRYSLLDKFERDFSWVYSLLKEVLAATMPLVNFEILQRVMMIPTERKF